MGEQGRICCLSQGKTKRLSQRVGSRPQRAILDKSCSDFMLNCIVTCIEIVCNHPAWRRTALHDHGSNSIPPFRWHVVVTIKQFKAPPLPYSSRRSIRSWEDQPRLQLSGPTFQSRVTASEMMPPATALAVSVAVAPAVVMICH
jgi:hypothetical protein